MVQENLGLRILAIVLAVLIWLQSVLASDHRTQVNLKVNLTSLPQNLTLDNVPKSIPFTVKGRGWDIVRFIISKPKVSIDASKITPDTDIIALDNYQIDIPQSFNITLIGPAQSDKIAIQADVFHRKTVPVRLEFADESIRKRLSELSYIVNPEEVTVFGPKTRIQSVSNLLTIPITNEMLAQSKFDVALVMPVDDVSISDSKVSVSVSGTQLAVRVFSDISLPSWCLPSKVAVKVQGSGAVLSRLQSNQLNIKVAPEPDADGYFGIEVLLPDDVELLAISPDRVRQRQ